MGPERPDITVNKGLPRPPRKRAKKRSKGAAQPLRHTNTRARVRALAHCRESVIDWVARDGSMGEKVRSAFSYAGLRAKERFGDPPPPEHPDYAKGMEGRALMSYHWASRYLSTHLSEAEYRELIR